MRKLLAGVAALALTSVPIAASAAPVMPSGASSARPLALPRSVRTGARVTKSNKIGGASAIPIVIGAAIAAGVAYLVVDHEDKDDADSN